MITNCKRIYKIIGLLLIVAFSSCAEDEPKGLTIDQNKDDHTPPETWKEKWLDHDKVLTRMYYNDYVAVYYDNDVTEEVTWTYSFMSDVWEYVLETYGDFGSENRLYAVFHGEYTGIARTGNIFDEATSYRSLSDAPFNGLEMEGWNIDAPVHEVGHVVEGSSYGVHGSPAFDIWKDSKWAEIFQYDVYKGLNMPGEAERIYQLYINNSDDFPQDNTFWFKDWFYPIYTKYGEAEVLNSFFKLLSLYFPKENNGARYSGKLNWGEFVHFWSGAAQTDLKPLAEKAFGWSDEWESQWYTARAEFDKITY